MRITTNNGKKTIVFVFAIGIICLFSTFSKFSNTTFVYAKEQESEDVLDEQVIVDTSEVELLSGGKSSEDVVMIEGNNNAQAPFSTRQRNELTDAKFIPNANYFLLNPKHALNDGNDNAIGTCTTVAMQMLLGYHNYYSDRRILTSNYLAPDYGDINFDPFFSKKCSCQDTQGCSKIGTLDKLYERLFDLNPSASNPTYGQAIPLVVDAAQDFLEQNAEDIEDNISITWNFFSASQLKADIDDGKPCIIGLNLILENNFHVAPAYGYAKLDGEDGFLVHYGWGDDAVLAWVPESVIGFQIRMDVQHTHTYMRTGNFVVDYAIELQCTDCGYKKLERLYEMEEDTIVGVKASLVGNVTIPSVFEQYLQESALFINQAVSAIGDNAFSNQGQITSITIPDTVTSIGADAFNGCERLTSITIPESVAEIGDGVFEGCSSLTAVTIPSSITKISDRMFKGCASLTSFTIPSNIMEIGASAFMSSGLISIAIPNTVTSIGDYAFSCCPCLTAVTIPNSISSLSERLFYMCNYLEEINLPNGLISIENEVFYECENLNSIELPSSLTSIGDGAFAHAGLRTVEIPNGVVMLEEFTFFNCIQLTSIKLPTSLMIIQEEAFYGCINLTSFIIPNSVEQIGDYAFYGCGSIGQIIIPSTIVNIGDFAFAGCAPISLYVETYTYSSEVWSESWAEGGIILQQTTLSSDNSYVLSFYKGSTNSNYYLAMQNPTRVGYTFCGWSRTQNSNTALYESWQICTIPETGIFYACWIVQTVNISYKDVGGTYFSGRHAVGHPTTHTNGTDTALLRPSKLDYTFMGWYLNPEGTGAPINAIDGDELYDSTITVYAKWKKVSFTPILPTAIISLDTIEMMTANGSYIDSEGNVYLVEEDIEAYLNDTLTFYKKDDNLETI